MPPAPRPWLAPALLLLLLAVHAALAWPRRFYDDDVFITFRYARHVAEGHGMVWNTAGGAPVEGSTSLAWTLLNAAGLRRGLDPVVLSQAAGLLASLLGLGLVTLAARRFLGLPALLALAAPAFLVADRQWVLWGVSAQEIRTATTLFLGATLLLVHAAERGSRRAFLGSGGLFLAATLVRPEAPLLHLAAGLGVLLAGRSLQTLRFVLASGLVHAAGLAALVAWRLWYFGQPLPNTFYAKVGGLQLGRGLLYLGQFVLQSHGLLWAPVLLLGLVLLARRARASGGGRPSAPVPALVPALVVQGLLWGAWIAAEGGSTTEFRFLDPVLPAIALLVASALGAVASHGHPRLAATLAVLVVASQAATLARPFRPFPYAVSAEHLEATADFVLEQGRALAPYLGPHDRIASGWAGALPYVTDAWHLDGWGLNDPVIARRPFQRERMLYHQRHATWDDVVSARVLACDVWNRFLFPAPVRPEEMRADANPWLREGVPVYAVELPAGRLRYWIFASALPPDAVHAWVTARGLRIVYALPLAAGPPPPPGARPREAGASRPR